jgi:hypothetical protein
MNAMKMNGKATIVISPYRATLERSIGAHVERAEALCLLLARAGVPTFASHLYATQFLNDANPQEREAGIAISKCWIERADRLAIWDPWGVSPGMAAEIAWAEECNRCGLERFLAHTVPLNEGVPALIIHDDAGDHPSPPATVENLTTYYQEEEAIQIHYFTRGEVPEWSGTFMPEGAFR